MGTSEYGKGKGNRRFPGRSGGRGKQKSEQWRSRAAHAVDNLATLGEHLTSLEYRGAWEKNPSERIYLLDQTFTRAGIGYAAELRPGRWRPIFAILVPESQREEAAAIITKLEQRERLERVHDDNSLRKSVRMIEPADVPDHLKNHPWEFLVYIVYGNDHITLSYTALLFRNKTHMVFGIREWHGPGAPYVLNKMAGHIVVDEEFRRSLITDNPRVPEMWEELE